MATAITGVRVWDGSADVLGRLPQTVRIEDGGIAGVGSGASLVRGAQVIDLPGATLLPGLIDAHVHLCLDPTRSGPATAEGSRSELAEMAERARTMVRAGITTARDLGGGDYRELALRDAVRSGATAGPRLLCAGQPLTSRGGHCHFWGGEAEGAEEIRAVVERQLARGVDWVKVMATGGVLTKGTSPGAPQFDAADLGRAVDVAHAAGRRVAAHCHGTAGIANAAEAGVDTVEHCSFVGGEGFGSGLDLAVVERLAERGAVVSPTVNAGWRRFTSGEGNAFGERMRSCFAALRRAGVPLIASTDAGIPRVAHDGLPDALPVFAELAALSPVETLRSATSGAAGALGIGAQTGRIEAGLAADLLVVDGNPLEEWGALRRPVLVVAAGRRAT